MNMNNLMAQAQKMQKDIQNKQNEIKIQQKNVTIDNLKHKDLTCIKKK